MNININTLSSLFKANKKEVQIYCGKLLKKKIKFKYLNENEKKIVFLNIIKKVLVDKQKIGAKTRKKIWFNGWNESLNLIRKKKDNTYLPKYLTASKNNFFRLDGKIIKAKQDFEIKMMDIYRHWYLKKYLKNVDNIYEFGAGTGHNLIAISKIYPKKQLYGSDFVRSSVNILKNISNKKNLNLKPFLFDMEKPNKKIKLKENSAVYTSGALEQLSSRIESFIDFTLKNKPKIVIHSEPVVDFYNINNSLDLLGKTWHLKRGYTSNLYSILSYLHKKKKIKIIKTLKSPFGGLMMEGYSLIIWKPFK